MHKNIELVLKKLNNYFNYNKWFSNIFKSVFFSLILFYSCSKIETINIINNQKNNTNYLIQNWRQTILKNNPEYINKIDSIINHIDLQDYTTFVKDSNKFNFFKINDNLILGFINKDEKYNTLGIFKSNNFNQDQLLSHVVSIYLSNILDSGKIIEKYNLDNKLLSTYIGLKNKMIKEIRLVSEFSKESNISKNKSLSLSCIDWYLVTYINGVEISRIYVYTTCNNALMDLPIDESVNGFLYVDPCIDAKKINDSLNNLYNSNTFSNVINQFNNVLNNSNEYSISLTRNPTDGQLGSLIPSTSNSPDSSTMNTNYSNVIAEIHNHPNSGPPSEGDIYGLITANLKHPSLNTRFILNPNNDLYSIVIQDLNKATNFMNKAPMTQYVLDNKNYYSFPSEVKSIFLDFYNQASGYSDNIATLLSYAYVFQTYDAGIYIYKKESNDDSFIKMTPYIDSQINGTKIITNKNCY